MANFNLVIDSKFRPFSYQELLAPALMATQAHQAVENEYNEYDAKASVWEGMADEVNDEKTYKQYKKYAEDLREQADILAKEGLNINSRRALGKMKSRYSSEIVPIEQAYNARELEKKRQAEAYDRDDSIMFSRDAATTSLDDYLGGNISPYRQASGRKITADVAAQAGNLAKVLRGYGPGARIDDYTKSFLKRYGFTPEEVQRAINNPKDAKSSKVLDAIVESTMSASDMAGWKNKALLNRGYDYAREGLWAAIGQNQVSPMEDYLARYRLQHPPVDPTANRLPLNPINIYSTKEKSDIASTIKDYSKYFSKKAGKTYLNDAGMKEYQRKYTDWKDADFFSPLRTNRKEKDSDFKVFMDSLGLNPNQPFSEKSNFGAGELWDKYLYDNDTERYDSKKFTEYDYQLKSADQATIKDALMKAASDNKLEEVDFDSKTKSFKKTGDNDLSLEDLKNDKFRVVSTRTGAYGTSVIVVDEDGNKRRYKMPAGINTTNERARDASFKIANTYAEALKNPKLSKEDRAYLEKEWSNEIQKAMLHHSQLFGTNTTAPSEYSYTGF